MTYQGDVSRFQTTWQTMCLMGYLKRYLDLLQHWKTRTFDTFLYEISLVNLTHDAGFFVGINGFFRIQNFALCANRYETAHDARKTTCADWEKQYFDRNMWDMSIDITYCVLDILQVVISRSTYYISFERMCLTVINSIRSRLIWIFTVCNCMAEFI